MIGTAIMGIAMMAFASMMNSQQKETRALAEKLAALSLKGLLGSALANGSVCLYELNNPSLLTFDSSSPSAIQAAVISVNQIHASASNSAPLIAKVGNLTSPETNTLWIQGIQLTHFQGSGNSYTAEWTIHFDSTKTVRPVKPISIPVSLSVDNSTPTATKITGCMNSSGSAQFTNITHHTFCNTGMGGTVLKSTQANRICSLSGVDDDVGNTGVVAGGGEYKCRVGNNGGTWRGYAPLGCGQVACEAICFDVQ